MTENVNAIASSASQQLYVLKILKAHGLPSQSDLCCMQIDANIKTDLCLPRLARLHKPFRN